MGRAFNQPRGRGCLATLDTSTTGAVQGYRGHQIWSIADEVFGGSSKTSLLAQEKARIIVLVWGIVLDKASIVGTDSGRAWSHPNLRS